MSDLSLTPAPSAAAPAPAPAPAPIAPVAPRPAAAPPKAETPDPDEDEDTQSTRLAPTQPKVTAVGAASSSEAGGLADFVPGGDDAATSPTSTGRALQPLPTVTRVGADPTATGPSVIEGVSNALGDCASGTNCRSGMSETMPIAVGSLSKCPFRFEYLRLTISWRWISVGCHGLAMCTTQEA